MGLPPSVVLSTQEMAHYETLRSAKYFASRGVGIAGVEPPEARAFVALARSSHGATAFKYLLIRGSMAGKVYALVGLRRVSPAFFQLAVQPFRVWPGEVDTFFGCILSLQPVRTLVESDEPEAVRLRPGETLVDRYRSRGLRKRFVLDVVGGGYTSMFLEWEQLARPIA
jgi:hypothetical protein